MNAGTRIDVALPAGLEHGGWVLLQGRLSRRGGDHDARLCCDGGGGWDAALRLPVSTTLKGRVHQVLRLPAGVRRLALDPGCCAGFEAEGLRVRPLGALARRAHMWRDVVPQLWRQPRARLAVLGLGWWRALADLPRAYERATRLRAHAAAPDYASWVRAFDTLGDDERRRIAAEVAGWREPPFFHVVLFGSPSPALQRTQASLDGQIHRAFACHEVADAPALEGLAARLRAATEAEWVLPLRAGDVLAPQALAWMAAVARAAPEAAVLYADEDRLDAAGARRAPRLKPAWSWAHARATPFFGEAVALRAPLLARAGGITAADALHGSYDLVLRTLDAAPAGRDAARHLPAVLLHRGGDAQRAPRDPAWAMEAVRSHLARRGLPAQVEPLPGGRWRVRHLLPAQPPLVSIVVPTRDALELTRRCVETLRARTRYPRYELLLVDNQSRDPAALAWMRGQADAGALRLLHYDAPFNYASINNMAVRAAAGELVCLLNNDTEIVQPDWLDEMVAQALEPGVDVVGAKLLYPDGRVQHAGDVVGVGGVANHAHAWLDRDAPGYCGRAVVAQEFSAVTGACLLTWRQRFLDLGGLDAQHLAVNFNDVDYCLRVRARGGRVVWTPHAVLVHHESVTRGSDRTPARRRAARREAATMRRRWARELADDPFYSPALSRERADFSLNPAPVLPRPWQS